MFYLYHCVDACLRFGFAKPHGAGQDLLTLKIQKAFAKIISLSNTSTSEISISMGMCEKERSSFPKRT